ncbi:MAG: ABC transporter ATP-binding protein [Bacillota bacterium]
MSANLHTNPAPQRPTAEHEIILRLDKVSMEFESDGRTVRALEEFTLDVRRGEFLTIVGPSGCGKSTVLNSIVGLLEPTHGKVYYKGQPHTGINTEIGYVTQEDNLFPWRTALGSVEFGMEVRGFPKEERRRRALELIEAVGLKGFENHYRHQLSGGMRQRVNIIRTLSYRPEVILMDEPFGPLDAQTRIILQDELLKLWQAEKATIIFITHDLSEAIAMADRVLVMSRRPGRVLALKEVNIPRPRDVYSISENPEYQRLHEELWRILREEVRPEGGGQR